jgi:cytochrome c peroxidase
VGSKRSLDQQIDDSIDGTMHGYESGLNTPEHRAELAAFLATLKPAPALAMARGDADASAAERGRRLFAELRCDRCHAGPAGTDDRTHDVGLRDELGLSRFSPPSLRGVSQRGPYLHDGRAPTLREAIQQHADVAELSPPQWRDLLEYLRGL